IVRDPPSLKGGSEGAAIARASAAGDDVETITWIARGGVRNESDYYERMVALGRGIPVDLDATPLVTSPFFDAVLKSAFERDMSAVEAVNLEHAMLDSVKWSLKGEGWTENWLAYLCDDLVRLKKLKTRLWWGESKPKGLPHEANDLVKLYIPEHDH